MDVEVNHGGHIYMIPRVQPKAARLPGSGTDRKGARSPSPTPKLGMSGSARGFDDDDDEDDDYDALTPGSNARMKDGGPVKLRLGDMVLAPNPGTTSVPGLGLGGEGNNADSRTTLSSQVQLTSHLSSPSPPPPMSPCSCLSTGTEIIHLLIYACVRPLNLSLFQSSCSPAHSSQGQSRSRQSLNRSASAGSTLTGSSSGASLPRDKYGRLINPNDIDDEERREYYRRMYEVENAKPSKQALKELKDHKAMKLGKNAKQRMFWGRPLHRGTIMGLHLDQTYDVLYEEVTPEGKEFCYNVPRKSLSSPSSSCLALLARAKLLCRFCIRPSVVHPWMLCDGLGILLRWQAHPSNSCS